MKKKEIVDLASNLILLILSFAILLFPIFKITNIKLILGLIFGFYAFIKLISFIFVLKSKDYENLYTSIISLGCFIAIFLINLTSKNIALLLLVWALFMSLIKLKKADFYHDRKNKMWMLRILILLVFITISILTSMNLVFSELTTVLLGYYFLINSLLDTIDPLACYIMR